MGAPPFPTPGTTSAHRMALATAIAPIALAAPPRVTILPASSQTPPPQRTPWLTPTPQRAEETGEAGEERHLTPRSPASGAPPMSDGNTDDPSQPRSETAETSGPLTDTPPTDPPSAARETPTGTLTPTYTPTPTPRGPEQEATPVATAEISFIALNPSATPTSVHLPNGAALQPEATATASPSRLQPTASRLQPTASRRVQVATPTPLPPDRIVATSIGLDAPVVPVGQRMVQVGGQTAVIWDVADYAAGWHKDSARPGQRGNIVISGHHNIKGEVFRYVVQLEEGDEIVLYAGGRPYRYVVQRKMILKEKGEPLEVRQRNARWIAPSSDERLTLVTCWPYTSNTHRVIVVAKPVRTPAAHPTSSLDHLTP